MKSVKYDFHELGNDYLLQFEYNNKNYMLSTHNNILVINGNCYKLTEKPFKFDYIFKIQKTQILVRSKENLFKHFVECLKDNFAVECWTVEPIENILKNCKQLKA